MSLDNNYLSEVLTLETKYANLTSDWARDWAHWRVPVIAPLLQLAVNVSLIMIFMLFLERVYMATVLIGLKLRGIKPEKVYKFAPIEEDVELGSSACPMVLVQIPMYNEKEVYQLSIQAACGLVWPSDRIVIQVLDDSTNPEIKALVQAECQIWKGKGLDIKYVVRSNRNGYKAGALREGMMYDYVASCDYVAIFDADFQPEPDFLKRTVPYLVHNTEVGLVQARWKFVNENECFLTRMQQMSLENHFVVEQPVGSGTYAFFGFNGTAGVWRISALNDAGGWKDRTTVEDMDLAVRAGLEGWKFVFLADLAVKSELPSTFKAYRYQQHRWACGPACLFRKIAPKVLTSKKVSAMKKWHILYQFFFVRKVVAHISSYFFFCVIFPATVLVPKVRVPMWAAVYAPSVITLLNAASCLRSFHLVAFWVLFENVMAMHRTKATIVGLFDLGGVNEWVVTDKLGNLLSKGFTAKKSLRIVQRIYPLEMITSFYLFFCASYDLVFNGNFFWVYLYGQAITFLICGLGYVGTILPD